KSVRVLAAPAIGTGVGADLCDFGFVAARELDLRLDADTVARTTWKMIENTSIRPMKEGKILRHESETVAYLRDAADRLRAEKLGFRKRLGFWAGAKRRRPRPGSWGGGAARLYCAALLASPGEPVRGSS